MVTGRCLVDAPGLPAHCLVHCLAAPPGTCCKIESIHAIACLEQAQPASGKALELQRPCVVLLSPEEPDLQEQCVRARVAPNAESLKQSAQVLQEVLVAAQLAANQSYDVEPGDSSDEEGGSDEGIRLRVRLRREEDKWGIKWHQQMSRRLVVDEIAEGSPIDRWNASQPQGLQVRYGDRLERINGIRVRGSPAEVAGQFRVELHKEEHTLCLCRCPDCQQ
eukprot:g29310.t1